MSWLILLRRRVRTLMTRNGVNYLPWLLAWSVAVQLVGCGPSPLRESNRKPPGYWYIAKGGETLQTLRKGDRAFNIVDVEEINGLRATEKLVKGQKVFLFGVRKTTGNERVSGAKPRRPRKTGTPAKQTPGNRKWRYPINGARLTSRFGRRGNRPHKGVDFAAKMGTPIYATADGVVIYSGSRQRGYGNLVILKHSDDYVSVYAHNRRNLVDEGQKVRQGSQIAELGNSGRSTGPHLHFEIRHRGKPLDPLRLLGTRE